MGRKIAIVGLLAASIVAASAASYSTTTVGTINGNSVAFTEATGNSNNEATFASSLATAFATNGAGVWNFDGTSYTVGNGDTITLSYGTSQSSTLVLTFTCGSGDSIGQGNPSSPTSGSYEMTENGSAADRVFTPSQPLLAVSIFNLNRGDSSRTAVLNVTFLDNTTASTSGANGGATYFHELSANPTNPIVKFTISNSNLNRYDDLGFIVAPPIALPPPPWAVATNSVTTNSISVKFVNNSGSGVVNTNADSLLPAETAGAPGYTQANWNNFAQTGGNYSGGFAVSNSLGAATPLIISWAGNSTGSSGTGTGLGTPDGKLMDGFLAINGNLTTGTVSTNVPSSPATTKPLVYLSGLKAWYQAQGAEGFGVTIYENDDGYYDTSIAWVQSVTGSPTNNTMAEGPDLKPRLYNTHSAVFNGIYTQIPNTATNQANKSYGANYCVFNGLTNDAVLIRSGETNESWGAGPMNGFQIVPIFPTMPTAGTPTFSPSSTIYAGVPVTLTEMATGDSVKPQLWYQWYSDNASGGAVNNAILNATNATLNIAATNNTSTYYVQYLVVVTNVFGVSTSSVVTLTVNPAVAPYVTTDTTPGPGNSLANVYAFANASVTFNAAFGGPVPITYQWQADTGSGYTNILDATNTTVTVTNLQLASSGNYRLMAHNVYGDTPSTAAALTVLADLAAPDASQAYAYAVFTKNPVGYWRFSETIDSTANSMQAYDYSGNNHDATYGAWAFDMQPGPSASSTPACPGFESANTSVSVINNQNNSWLDVPALNLNTNTVTITAWIKPTGAIGGGWGLFMWRGTNGDAAGLGFGGTVSNNMAELGYNWNSNSPSTYNYHSGLYAPFDQWSFVALTITPTNSTLYLYYTDGSSVTNISKAVQNITNISEAFSGGTLRIGSDNYAGRNFNGGMDEVAIFNKSLSEAQIQNLFSVGSGIAGVAPYISKDISANPTNSANLFPGQVPVQLSVVGSGMPTPGFQWQAGSGGVFTNLPNSGAFSGANSGTLTINPVMPANYLDYRLLLTNISGSVTSSVYTVQMVIIPTNGLWTACYQFTNAGGGLWFDNYGSGSYSGPGALGAGNFWNPIPGRGSYSGGSFTSVSDYMVDGSTHSGVTCTLNQVGLSFAVATPAPYDATNRAGLLTQFALYLPAAGVTVTNAMTISLPNGSYNLAFHGAKEVIGNVGTVFTVHGANGDQTGNTTNTGQFTYFINHDTSVVITNVQVANGVLNVDGTSDDASGQFAINAAEIQLVSYAPPTAGFSASPTTVFAGQLVTFTNAATPVTNLFWTFGDGNTLNTTVNGNATHAYATPGTYTVSQTVKNPGGTASVTNTAYITVLAKPTIGSAKMSAGNFVLSGTGGISARQYRILTSTNLALPLASWTTAATDVFALDGSYSYTNSSPTNAASFYIMVTP